MGQTFLVGPSLTAPNPPQMFLRNARSPTGIPDSLCVQGGWGNPKLTVILEGLAGSAPPDLHLFPPHSPRLRQHQSDFPLACHSPSSSLPALQSLSVSLWGVPRLCLCW